MKITVKPIYFLWRTPKSLYVGISGCVAFIMMSDAADSKTTMQILSGIAGMLTKYQPVKANSNNNVDANREKQNNIDAKREKLPDHLQQK